MHQLRQRATRYKALWLLLLFIGLGVLVYIYRDVQPLRCPFNSFLGLPCPGCGTMRAFYALLEGRIGDAFRMNTPALIALSILSSILIVKAIDAYQGSHYYERYFELKQSRIGGIWIIIILAIAYGLISWYLKL